MGEWKFISKFVWVDDDDGDDDWNAVIDDVDVKLKLKVVDDCWW